MTRRIRALVPLVLLVLAALGLMSAPAGAQQLIDATEQGGEAFIAMTIMVVLFAFTLFYMDRVRRRHLEDEHEDEHRS